MNWNIYYSRENGRKVRLKIKRISEHIWSISSWFIIPFNVWLVKDDEGVSLVDTGISTMGSGILKFIDKLDVDPLSRILLTHGHSDHVGSIKKIRLKREVPIYAHREEIPYMEGKLPYPRRKKSQALVESSIATPLEEDASNNLTSIGDLMPYHTPGHSPGHVVYYHQKDSVLIGGDLFTSRRHKLQKPMAMFTGNMDQAIKSGQIVKLLKPKILCVCHGSTVQNPHEQYDVLQKNYFHNRRNAWTN